MKKYNYADEIIKDDNWLQQSKYANNYEPKENILKDEDQNIPVNTIDELIENNNEPEGKIKAFEEGIRNDNIVTEKNNDEEEV